MKKLLMCLTGLALALGGGQTAKAGFVNFDDVVLSGTGTAAADRYISEGVLFSASIPLKNIENSFPTYFNDFFVPGGGSGPNAMTLNLVDAGTLMIEAMFVLPGTLIPTTADFVQVDVFDTNVGTSLGMLEAFDVNDQLLDSVQMTTSLSQHAVYTITAQGIAKIKFTQDEDGGAFDNLSFTLQEPGPELVPEPSSLALLGIGSIGLIGYGWRRRKQQAA